MKHLWIVAAIALSLLPEVGGEASPELFRTDIGGPGNVRVYLLDGRPVARGTADESGRVTVPLRETAELGSLAAGNGGYVNFMALALRRGAAKPFYFSRTFDAGVWSAGTSPEVPAILDMDGAAPASGEPADAPDAGCSVFVLDSQDVQNVVGEVHTGSDMTAKLTYGKTADSDMGVGFSSDGSRWALSGTVHVGNSESTAETWNHGEEYGHRELSEFHWQKRKVGCPVGGDHYDIVATAWNAGAVNGADIHSYDHQCKTTYDAYKIAQAPGTEFDRQDADFVTWSIDTGAFGIGLSAKSGASTFVHIHYAFNQPAGIRYICGSDAKPPDAHRIFAGT
jgi:hypothetical protein